MSPGARGRGGPGGAPPSAGAPDDEAVCVACARRAWLLARLSGHLDRVRARIDELLVLDDAQLRAAVAGADADAVRDEALGFDPAAAAVARARAGVTGVCRCADGYPDPLRALPGAPALLHVRGGVVRLGELSAGGGVAVVGSRKASVEGRRVAAHLAGRIAAAGPSVISGLALGIDAAAHAGALEAGGDTVCVLPAGAERAYPASHRALYEEILRAGGVMVSELPPGVPVRRWMFPARNRIIAGLAQMTIVVQADERSGSLITADWAARLGRPVGAVPGSILSRLSRGPHALLRDGARLVAGAGDVLDALGGPGAAGWEGRPRPPLAPPLQALLDALQDGETGEAAFARAGLDPGAGLVALTSLELIGRLTRGPGGRHRIREP